MNKRRLLKLADLLEADAKNKKGIKFDLGTVGRPSDSEKNFKVGELEPAVSCNTAACAMGLAAISGAFKRQGLSFVITRFGDINCTIDGRGHFYATAAERLFEISEPEAMFLFSPSEYCDEEPTTGAKGERFVAKRIRDFVAGKVSPT
jgi:hypothetical protein